MKFLAQKRLMIIAMLTVAFVVSATAVAAEQSTLTSSHINKIRQNCVAAQVALQRVQYNDVAIRINRGQAYDALLTKFIAPFNSRAALNRLSEVDLLTAKTEVIEAHVEQFKKDYVKYEDTLSESLRMKCQDRPVAFYDALGTIRELRAALSADTKAVQTAIEDYEVIVGHMRKTIEENQ